MRVGAKEGLSALHAHATYTGVLLWIRRLPFGSAATYSLHLSPPAPPSPLTCADFLLTHLTRAVTPVSCLSLPMRMVRLQLVPLAGPLRDIFSHLYHCCPGVPREGNLPCGDAHHLTLYYYLLTSRLHAEHAQY